MCNTATALVYCLKMFVLCEPVSGMDWMAENPAFVEDERNQSAVDAIVEAYFAADLSNVPMSTRIGGDFCDY